MNRRDTLPGWYGKLPALGDFASRRMGPDLLAWWDAWLAEGLLDLQTQHRLRGSNWLDAYLVSPSWQFLLSPACLPGELGHQAWMGCLMPSVDRVGRYFPFLVLQSLPALPRSLAAWRAVQARLQALDACAADALEQDWVVEQVEAELEAALRSSAWPDALWSDPGDAPAAAASPGHWLDVAATPDLASSDPVLDAGLRLWAQSLASSSQAPRSYWRAQPAGQAARWRVCAGMPQRASALLGGE